MKKHFSIKISIVLVILTLFLSNFSFNNEKNIANPSLETPPTISIENPHSMITSPNSRPLLATQHAVIEENYENQYFPFNSSYTIMDGWSSVNSTVNYQNISFRKEYVQNGDLLTSSTNFSFKTNATAAFYNGVWDKGNIRITVDDARVIYPYQYGYWEQNVTIPESFNPGKNVSFSIDYYFTAGGTTTVNPLLGLYLGVVVGGIEYSQMINVTELDYGVWSKIIFSYNPSEYGQIAPNIATLRFGAIPFATLTCAKKQEFRFDNIGFKCWAQPNHTDVINYMDCETTLNYSYTNTSAGSGFTYCNVQKLPTQTTEYSIAFTANSLYSEIYADRIIVDVFVQRTLNSTYYNQIGSFYSIQSGEVNWNTNFYFTGPSDYKNMTIEIDYPFDWQILHIWDCYEIDRILECSGVEYGQSIIHIPASIFEAGLWKINAISYNYIDQCDILGWNGTTYLNQSEFYLEDHFQISVRFNNSVVLSGTTVNLTIFTPNNALFYQETKNALPMLLYGNFHVGLNMSIGTYLVRIEWRNNDSVLDCDKVGFYETNFAIFHHTCLIALESEIVRYENEPLLLKMNFTDTDSSLPIEYASLSYNCSSGDNGTFVYLGSGIYAADIDTSILNLGVYLYSFNATKSYYQKSTLINNVTVTIVPDRLSLDVPRDVRTFSANSFAYFQFNLTGEFFGDFLNPANISTDWPIMYSVTDWNNGSYGLNLSTFEMTSTGVPETFTVLIYANKTNFGFDSDSISFTLEPCVADVQMNQSVLDTYLFTNFSIAVNYTDNIGQKIPNSSCSVFWETSYQIFLTIDGFLIEFSTEGLISDYFTGYIELNHNGYEKIRKAFFVFIKPIKAELILNQTVYETYLLDNFSTSVTFTNAQTDEIILDGDCEVTWYSNYTIQRTATGFVVEFSTEGLSADYFMGYIQVNRSGYETIRKVFYVVIRPIKTTLIVLNPGPIRFIKGDIATISCSLLVKSQILDSATLTFIGLNMNSIFVRNGKTFYFAFNTSTLEVKSHLVQILATGENLESNIIDVVFEIVPLTLKFEISETFIQ